MRNLLIGCGSVGKRNLAKLIELGERIWVVDPSEEARNYALSRDSLVSGVSSTIENYLENESSVATGLVVIANWGPDHFYIFERIKDLNPRTILIEKPITSKLSDLNSMKKHVAESKASIIVDFHLRFESGFERLSELCKTRNYGTPALISIIAGAKCISTNGIHWIDFANQLIASEWNEINSSTTSQPINPRSKSLNFFEGFTNIIYKNKSTMNINFTNSSCMDIQTTIVWKTAKAVIVNGFLNIYEPGSDIPIDQPVTRSAHFSKKTLEMPFPLNGFDRLYSQIGQVQGHKMENLLAANELLILSLISSASSSQIRAHGAIPQDLIDFDWRVS